MPWTPIPKFPQIINNLKQSGRTKATGQIALENEIMRVLGLTNEKTISRTIRLMERLGYIKMKVSFDGTQTWEYLDGGTETKVEDNNVEKSQ